MDQTTSDTKQAISTFKSHLAKQGRASATILAYSKDIEQLADFVAKSGKNSLNEIKKDDIDAFKTNLAENNYTTKSISRKINSIKSFFNYVLANGLISENPSTGVSHPKYDIKPPRILNKIEYRALRDACREDFRMAGIVELLLQTGMRISEPTGSLSFHRSTARCLLLKEMIFLKRSKGWQSTFSGR